MKKSSATDLLIIGAALTVLSVFLIAPLVTIFVQAFNKGIEVYFAAVRHPETLAAVRLTVTTAFCAVCVNLLFGISAAWLIAKFRFSGRRVLLTIIDLPLAVSPVIAGMIFVLLYGSHGLFGPVLEETGLRIIFAEPGIILATTFVTLPYIVRELLPLMLEQGNAEEEAALTLGAKGFTVFRLVTLPSIAPALFYGLILANARAMGEFGAVSVVSGHVRGYTNTLPLHVEVLYNEYRFAAAFAVASLLALLAVVTLILKQIFDWRRAGVAKGGLRHP